MKKKLPSIKTARNKADSYLTPIIIAMHPKCLLCGKLTEVAHHHVHKSQSTRLRYVLSNLINLCNPCHLKLHMNESYYASLIVAHKGLGWFRSLDLIKGEYVKADVHYYLAQCDVLKKTLDDLSPTVS